MVSVPERVATVAGLFQSGALLPSQFDDMRRPFVPVPEVRLQIAVFERALDDLAGVHHPSEAARGADRAHLDKIALAISTDARLWIRGLPPHDNPDGLFTFVSICERLGLSPSAVRAAVLGGHALPHAGRQSWLLGRSRR